MRSSRQTACPIARARACVCVCVCVCLSPCVDFLLCLCLCLCYQFCHTVTNTILSPCLSERKSSVCVCVCVCVCVRVACALTQLSNAMQCFRTGDFPVRRSLSFAIGSARRALINCLTVFADEANEIAFHTRIYTNGQHEYDHDHGDDAEQRQNGLPSLRVEVG